MHPEVDELRPKLKEILYDCAVNIRATKAALYLFDGSSRFELVTEYGFRGTARDTADFNDPIIDRCGRGRTPFFVNGVGAEPRFSEILFEAGTDRLLAAPIYSRGKLVGVIDMRDKAAKALFENADAVKAQSIADRLAEVFADRNIFGQRFITLSMEAVRMPARETAPQAPPVAAAVPARATAAVPAAAPVPEPAPARPSVTTLRTRVPRLATIVIDARGAADRIMAGSPPQSLSENEISAARDVLRAILQIPGAVVAMFSAFGHLGGVQELASRSTLTPDAKALVDAKLHGWLAKRGESGGIVRTSVTTPLGTTGPPVTPAEVRKVFTAPLDAVSMQGLYLTVVFSGNPDRAAHELLAVLHAHLRLVIEQSVQSGSVSAFHARAAQNLLEPDFTKYPELRRHSELVAGLCESFARQLALSGAEVEQARLAGLVHDCGMRLLDYERLYRKRDLSAEELSFLREHAIVGAAMVEPLLGADLARIVLCHHERVDGRGYPNQLRGDDIPLAARILQLCDAWVAMTDADSYRAPESPESAQSRIAHAAGSQFDHELTPRFLDMVRQR